MEAPTSCMLAWRGAAVGGSLQGPGKKVDRRQGPVTPVSMGGTHDMTNAFSGVSAFIENEAYDSEAVWSGEGGYFQDWLVEKFGKVSLGNPDDGPLPSVLAQMGTVLAELGVRQCIQAPQALTGTLQAYASTAAASMVADYGVWTGLAASELGVSPAMAAEWIYTHSIRSALLSMPAAMLDDLCNTADAGLFELITMLDTTIAQLSVGVEQSEDVEKKLRVMPRVRSIASALGAADTDALCVELRACLGEGREYWVTVSEVYADYTGREESFWLESDIIKYANGFGRFDAERRLIQAYLYPGLTPEDPGLVPEESEQSEEKQGLNLQLLPDIAAEVNQADQTKGLYRGVKASLEAATSGGILGVNQYLPGAHRTRAGKVDATLKDLPDKALKLLRDDGQLLTLLHTMKKDERLSADDYESLFARLHGNHARAEAVRLKATLRHESRDERTAALEQAMGADRMDVIREYYLITDKAYIEANKSTENTDGDQQAEPTASMGRNAPPITSANNWYGDGSIDQEAMEYMVDEATRWYESDRMKESLISDLVRHGTDSPHADASRLMVQRTAPWYNVDDVKVEDALMAPEGVTGEDAKRHASEVSSILKERTGQDTISHLGEMYGLFYGLDTPQGQLYGELAKDGERTPETIRDAINFATGDGYDGTSEHVLSRWMAGHDPETMAEVARLYDPEPKAKQDGVSSGDDANKAQESLDRGLKGLQGLLESETSGKTLRDLKMDSFGDPEKLTSNKDASKFSKVAYDRAALEMDWTIGDYGTFWKVYGLADTSGHIARNWERLEAHLDEVGQSVDMRFDAALSDEDVRMASAEGARRAFSKSGEYLGTKEQYDEFRYLCALVGVSAAKHDATAARYSANGSKVVGLGATVAAAFASGGTSLALIAGGGAVDMTQKRAMLGANYGASEFSTDAVMTMIDVATASAGGKYIDDLTGWEKVLKGAALDTAGNTAKDIYNTEWDGTSTGDAWGKIWGNAAFTFTSTVATNAVTKQIPEANINQDALDSRIWAKATEVTAKGTAAFAMDKLTNAIFRGEPIKTADLREFFIQLSVNIAVDGYTALQHDYQPSAELQEVMDTLVKQGRADDVGKELKAIHTAVSEGAWATSSNDPTLLERAVLDRLRPFVSNDK